MKHLEIVMHVPVCPVLQLVVAFPVLFQGGMKAVVWTDTFQMIVVISGVITLVGKGLYEAGGFEKVMDTARDTERLDFNE